MGYQPYMPNLETVIIGFDIFCKVGSKMLLDLHHDFADAKGDFVRKAGAIVMPKEEKPTTKSDMTGAAREAVARVTDNPTLANEAEFEVWAHAYTQQERRDMLKDLHAAPSVALGIS
jgi:hypothetical protein